LNRKPGCAGPGEGIDHLFYYPTEEQESYVVNQYVNGEAGAKGLSEIVKEISDASIKVRLLEYQYH